MNFYKDGNAFLENAVVNLESIIGPLPFHWVVDHICYRADSYERYAVLKTEFSKRGELLIESDVNGRPIATYKLKIPFIYKKYKVDVIELPAPKSGKITPEGFEHIEVVVDISFEEIMTKVAPLQVNKSGLSKTLNPELEVNFNGFNIKFHHMTLEEVIELEKK